MINNTIVVNNFLNIDNNNILISNTGAILEKDTLVNFLISKNSISKTDIYKKFSNDNKDLTADIHLLEKIGFISYLSNNSSVSSHAREISVLTLLVCQECNLRCKYCYGDGGTYNMSGFMSVEVAKKSIDYLFETSKKPEVCIVFFGGEPLLNFNLIKDCVDYSKQLCENFNKNVTYSITCNGTLLNDEIIKFLKDFNFTVTLSIDGGEKIHDSNRFYANKKGCFNNVKNNLNKIIDYKNLTCRSTVSDISLDYLEIYDELNDLNLNSIFMSPCNNFVDEDNYHKLSLSINKLFDRFMGFLEKGDYKGAKSIKNVYKILQQISSPRIRQYHCGAGISGLAVNINGDLFPCHRFVGNEDYVIGDIYSGLNEDKYQSLLSDLLISNRESCSNCKYISFCSGQCVHDNVVLKGSCRKTESYICSHNQKFIDEALKLYVSLNDEQKQSLSLK